MGILLWVVFGAIAGWIASMIVKSDQGLLLDIVVGIVGALIGGWVMNLLGYDGVSGFNVYSMAVAILGSVILLAIVKSIRRTA
ncbi:MAG: Transglycosylase associated protein [Parcubacteria bacterium C7867-007]|nr:MAG: Transglycosylase associated protein [Parcubacteria bacterium C7867-007]